MSATVLASAGKFVLGGLLDFFKHRREVKAEQRRGELALKKAANNARIARAQSGDDHAAAMDLESAGQRGWKDDYLLLLTTLPMVLLFAAPLFELVMATHYQRGDLQRAVQAGFSALKATPEFYWWGLGAVYIDTFGFRRMLRTAVETWAGQRMFGKRPPSS
ncbi:hypothetical protein [Microbulbifer spongiae]|uniref:Uncharacterized protein n=1 Tax=Microbulbifer spongiae TaxID=2944933 RepID=A0ABY9E5N5_9GAMM|nr:hypothetical protein [Microbulbifer sp. MI-G]WKD48338.1 hypothetical protein M8T91_10365 [Microbulbifer sp. MI-G]